MKYNTWYGRLIMKLGLRWKKTTDNKSQLIERHDIRASRNHSLRTILQQREVGWNIIYLEKTYIQTDYSLSKGWYNSSNDGYCFLLSKGKRIIVVHAGGE